MLLELGLAASAVGIGWCFFTPPVSKNWVPLANCEQASVSSYAAAAKRTGIRLMIRRDCPIDAPAGRLACAGMAGIWIHKEDADKERALMDAYFNGEIKRTRQNPWNCNV